MNKKHAPMNMLSVQVSSDNQQRLEAQGDQVEEAFNAATSNEEFLQNVTSSYESWANTTETQAFASDVEYFHNLEEVQRVGAHLDVVG